MLILPKDGVEFDVYIDSSQSGIGVMLMQQGKVIVYLSRQLKDFEMRYHIYDLELTTWFLHWKYGGIICIEFDAIFLQIIRV